MAEPKTLFEFLHQNDVAMLIYDDPNGKRDPAIPEQQYAAMSGQLGVKPGSNVQGDFRLTPNQLKSQEMMGQEIMDLAKKQGVDLTKFPEVRAAMGYDMDGGHLSAAELGAFITGLVLDRSARLEGGKVVADLTSETPIMSEPTAAQWKLAVDLGRQVFGDNYPAQSSTDTSTANSMQPIVNELKANPSAGGPPPPRTPIF